MRDGQGKLATRLSHVAQGISCCRSTGRQLGLGQTVKFLSKSDIEDLVFGSRKLGRQRPYAIAEHQHRLAAWAAGRAAFRGLAGAKVRNCRDCLEEASVGINFGIGRLATTPAGFDRQHRALCQKIIGAAKRNKLTLTYGVAAKMLNVYLKVRFVCGPDHLDARIALIHPPIDRTLLNTLADQDWGGSSRVWRKHAKRGWKNFSYDEYQRLISQLREHLNGDPFWTIEQHWQGYQ